MNSSNIEPLSCAEAELWISERVDGESSGAEVTVRLEAHLSACPGCRQVLEVETERSLVLAGRLSPVGAGSDQLVDEVLATVDSIRRRGGGRVMRGPFRVGAVISLAAAALFAVALFRAGGPTPDTGAPAVAVPDIPRRGRVIQATPVGGPVEMHLRQGGLWPAVTPAVDGSPRRRGLVRDKFFFVDPVPLQPSAGPRGENGQLELELERIQPIDGRLDSWPYR